MRFNEDFRNLHEVTEKLGLGHMHNLNLQADNATIIMACSGTEGRVHLHAFVILAKDGSVGLAKMALDTIIETAVSELGGR
jgi:hypothetical protein